MTKVLSLQPLLILDWDLLPMGLFLAAWERGIGGCVINGQGIMQSDVVREHAKIPDDQSIMICIAMGYPDDNFPRYMMYAPSGLTMPTLLVIRVFSCQSSLP